MEKRLTGRVYDIQGFSVQDGPGIRTTVFLKGCPLRCLWCHSPESQQFHPQLSWIAMRCAGVAECGNCLDACARRAISAGIHTTHPTTRQDIHYVRVDRSICDNCGDCAAACYRKALYMCGTDYTVDELLQRVLKDVPFYRQSGGGVTVSGGEPLCQPEFVLQFMKAMKENGLHTAIDTCGYVEWGAIEAVLPYTDLFLYDLKHMDAGRHRAATGVPNGLILENARKIAVSGGKMQIRIPIVPDFNDTEENIRGTGLFCSGLGEAVTAVQLLPYHNMGVMKYQRIDEGRIVLEADPPSDEKIRSLKELLETFGLSVTVH